MRMGYKNVYYVMIVIVIVTSFSFRKLEVSAEDELKSHQTKQ